MSKYSFIDHMQANEVWESSLEFLSPWEDVLLLRGPKEAQGQMNKMHYTDHLPTGSHCRTTHTRKIMRPGKTTSEQGQQRKKTHTPPISIPEGLYHPKEKSEKETQEGKRTKQIITLRTWQNYSEMTKLILWSQGNDEQN